MRSLSVLYDADCGVCCWARGWLKGKRKLVPLSFVAAGSTEARRRFPQLNVEETLRRLVVVSDDGKVWTGHNAWIVCLWALEDYRDLSMKLSKSGLHELAGLVAGTVSSNRYFLSQVIRLPKDPEAAAGGGSGSRRV